MKPLFTANNKKGDVFIPLTVIILSVFGLVMVYSSSKYSALTLYGDEFFYLKKQVIGFLLGLVAMIFFCFFDYKKLSKIKQILFIIGLVAMVYTVLSEILYQSRYWVNMLFIWDAGNLTTNWR